MRIGQRCLSCGKLMRPSNEGKEGWPGTKRYGGHGLCTTCNQARRDGRPLGPRRTYGTMPARCVECQEDLRHPSQPRTDDAASYAGHGLCSACKRAREEGRTRDPGRHHHQRGVVPCRGCDRPTRPSSKTTTECPRTVERYSKGFCRRCWNDGTAAQILKQAQRVHQYLTQQPA